jgi:hypothetical protein
MLTAKQYEGIGRFTIAFNEIDQVVEVYLPLVVKYSECTLPTVHRNPRTFHARAVAFRTALERASAGDEIAAAYAAGILKLLDRAEAIAATRNQYVHAVAFIDFQTNTRMLQMRNGDAAPDEKQITDLAMESAWLARHFAEECEGLLRMYIEINRREIVAVDGLLDGNGFDERVDEGEISGDW